MKTIERLNNSLKYNILINNRNVVAAICALEFNNMLNYVTTFAEQKFIESLIDICLRDVQSNTPMKLFSVDELKTNYKLYSGTVVQQTTPSASNCNNCIPKDGSITLDKLAEETIEYIEQYGGTEREVVSPVLSVLWTNTRTKEQSSNIDMYGEIGDTYTWEGCYYWEDDENKSAPNRFESNIFSSLTDDGVSSDTVTKTITSDSSFYIKFIAANGEVSKTSSSITFQYPTYYGVQGNLHKRLSSSNALTILGISTTDDEYFVYKYPKDLPALTQVLMNNTFDVIQAFDYSEESFVSDTGKTMTLRVYTSANPGAFTNVKLNFK